jgi:putative ABC transport system permease protein
MDRLRQNVRLALRRFVRAPGFTAIAVSTIALGIGANVAVFTVVDAVLLEPLPYENPEELVVLWEWHRPRDVRDNVANPGNFKAWKERSSSFSAMTAISLTMPATMTQEGEPNEVMIQAALPDFFSLLGVEATVGRTFSPDVQTDGPMEVVLSHRHWQSRYGGSPEVLGSTVLVNGHPAVIVGVLPSEYVIFGEGVDAWVAQNLEAGDQTNSGRWMMVLGRLAPGRTLEATRDEMQAIAAGLEEEFPDFNGGWTVNVVPLKQQVVGDVRASLWILLGAVGLLLLIACANVANLFLVRATERQKEMAVRTSLGASGSALAGQLFTESALIAGGGALLGLALAAWGTGTLVARMPDAFALPRVTSASVDGTVLAFTALVTVATAVLFGLLPAVQASGTSPAATLNAEGRGPSRRSGRARDTLVVAEVGLSVVLLAGALLLGRSMMTLLAVDDGLEPKGVLVGRVNLSGDTYPDPEQKVAFFEELLDDVEALPGVAAAGAITFLPMDGMGAGTSFWPADRPMPTPEERPTADIRNVAGEYFRSMGIELLKGRVLDNRDRRGAPQAVVVNRTLAESQWPGQDPIGQRVVVNWVDDTPWEVVGVVEDVRMTGLAEAPRESIYMHYPQATFFPWMHLTIRTQGDPTTLAPSVRSVLQDLDPALPLGSVRPMSDIVTATAARLRMTALLLVVFAGLATLIAAVGLYGVLAYAVSQRIREIGVRIAMGARPGTVLGQVLRQGARLAGVGLVLGLGAALAGGRFVSSLLYEVEPSDPVSLLGAGAALFTVALMACAVPAWRASRVPPAEALRSD